MYIRENYSVLEINGLSSCGKIGRNIKCCKAKQANGEVSILFDSNDVLFWTRKNIDSMNLWLLGFGNEQGE